MSVARTHQLLPRDQLLLHALQDKVGADWDIVSKGMVTLSYETTINPPNADSPAEDQLFSPARCELDYKDIVARHTRGRQDTAIGKVLRKRHLDELQRSIRKHEEEFRKLSTELWQLQSGKFDDKELEALRMKYEAESTRYSTIIAERQPKLDRFPLPEAITRQSKDSASAPEISSTGGQSESQSDTAITSNAEVTATPPETTHRKGDSKLDETADSASKISIEQKDDQVLRSPSKTRSRRMRSGHESGEADPALPMKSGSKASENQPSTANSSGTTTPAHGRSRRGSPNIEETSSGLGYGAETTASSRRGGRGRKRTRADADEGEEAIVWSAYCTPERSPEPMEAIEDSVSDDTSESAADDRARAQRAWKAAAMQLWNQIAENKNANLFRHPVDPKKVDGYADAVHRPMDLGTIKRHIETGLIVSARDMEHALMLMFTNALMFNTSGEFVYQATLEMREDTLSRLAAFREIMTSGENVDHREGRRKKQESLPSKSKRTREAR